MKQSKDIYDVILDKKRIIIPIVEFEGVAFLISIEDFCLDIHTFIDKVSKNKFICLTLNYEDFQKLELCISHSPKFERKASLFTNF